MAGAPVCTVPTQAPTTQPLPTAMPAIPAPTPSIAGLMASVTALKRAVETLSGQKGGLSGFTTNPSSKKSNQDGRWKEVDRVKETVRVFNPNDSSQFVDVLRINKLVFQDTVTGETWIWNR